MLELGKEMVRSDHIDIAVTEKFNMNVCRMSPSIVRPPLSPPISVHTVLSISSFIFLVPEVDIRYGEHHIKVVRLLSFSKSENEKWTENTNSHRSNEC